MSVTSEKKAVQATQKQAVRELKQLRVSATNEKRLTCHGCTCGGSCTSCCYCWK